MAEDYSYNDLMQMQEQAIRRAREMQQRARITVREAQVTDIDEAAPPFPDAGRQNELPPEEEANSDGEVPSPARIATPMSRKKPLSSLFSVLQRLPADDDMRVILPIIMMLLKEGADEKLILALLYIMT